MFKPIGDAWIRARQLYPNVNIPTLFDYNKGMIKGFLEENPTEDSFADILHQMPFETIEVFMEYYREIEAFQKPFTEYVEQLYRKWGLNPLHSRLEQAFPVEERSGFWKAGLHYAITPDLPHPWESNPK